MSEFAVDVGVPPHTYRIHIADGIAARLGSLLDVSLPGRRRVLVASPRVWALHGRDIAHAAGGSEPVLIPDGERAKTVQTVSRLYDSLVALETDRSTVLVAIGGGVLGDTAGFAAATYLRGLALVHVPTTLVAQVDSAIGGKVGVNHRIGKNLIGAFYPPALVAIDPRLLTTLPKRELRAGLYEVIKYGVIASPGLFERLECSLGAILDQQPEALVPTIAECCRIKADVVTADDRESGLRRILNFGHTTGHALEAVTAYRRFRHGEAVAYGMLAAAEIAATRGICPVATRDRLATLIGRLGRLPRVEDISIPAVIAATRYDKKMMAGRLHFVLPTTIGATTIVDDVTGAELCAALRKLGLSA